MSPEFLLLLMAFTALCLMVLTAYCDDEDVLSGRFTSPSSLDTPHVATIHHPPHVTPDTADFFS
jgi:hypothetical protein